MRKRKLAAVLILALVFAACQDKDLETVANALNDTARGIGVFQSTVIDANAQGLLNDDTTRQLLQVSVRVNMAGQDAVAVTRDLVKLQPQDRTQLLNILKPLIDVLSQADSQLIGAIPDERARANVRSALLVVSTALNTAQLALALR